MRYPAQKIKHRPTWAEIRLSSLEYNINQVKNLVGKQAKILAVVKADAYGHGAVRIAQRLQSCGIEYFGVATVPEAVELRQNKIKGSILVLSTVMPSELPTIIKHDITLSVSDINTAICFNNILKKLNRRIPVHIKIDTGMGRIGVWHKDALSSVRKLSNLNNLILEGIYSHFPSADDDLKFTNAQIRSFKQLIDSLEKENIFIPLRHMANSVAVMRHKNSYLNLVRPGLMLYGLYSDAQANKSVRLKPILSFKTRITYLKEIDAGRSVSYNRTFIAKDKTRIATLPVGYADGYNRLLSNRADVLVKGRRCRVVGRVCMDHIMVDVTKVKARIGDEVVLMGRQRNAEISVEEIAQLCSTISYEVVCWISQRVPRIYID